MRSLDDFGRPAVADLDNVIDVIAHCHKQIEKQFTTFLHFHLHSTAPLESLATSDDQRQVMSAEPRLCVGSVFICISCRTQDNIDLDARLKALFPQSQFLQVFQAVLICRTIHYGVPKDIATGLLNEDCRFAVSAATRFYVLRIFEIPCVTALVVQQAGVVIAFVQEFENAGEDFGFFVRQLHLLATAVKELAFQVGGKER